MKAAAFKAKMWQLCKINLKKILPPWSEKIKKGLQWTSLDI
jgi:hypothetical protein